VGDALCDEVRIERSRTDAAVATLQDLLPKMPSGKERIKIESWHMAATWRLFANKSQAG
jgi:hypothetical protein